MREDEEEGDSVYSVVTDLAKFLGKSTSKPLMTAK